MAEAAPTPDTTLQEAYDPSVHALRLTVGPPPLPEKGNAPEPPAVGELIDKASGGLAGGTNAPPQPSDSEMAARVAGHAGLPPPAIGVAETPAKATPGPPPSIPAPARDEYARSMVSGETTGPQDFAERFAGAVGQAARQAPHSPQDDSNAALGEQAKGLAALAMHTARGLPTQEDLIDSSLRIAHGQGGPVNPESARTVRENLLSWWAKTGEGPADAEARAAGDPLFQDALTHPQGVEPPEQSHQPTIAELSKPNRDAIYDPTAPFGRKDLAELPGALEAEAARQAVLDHGKSFSQMALDPKAMEEALGVALSFGPGSIGDAGTKALKAATGDLKPILTNLDDDLNRLRTNGTADRVSALKLIGALPPEMRAKAIRELAYTETEQRMVRAKSAQSPEVRAFLRTLKPLTDQQRALGGEIAAMIGKTEAERAGIGLQSVEEGHVHRVVIGRERPGGLIDPSIEQPDVITGASGGQRTLSKFAAGMQHRSDFWVLQNGDARVWGSEPLEEMGGYGAKHPDPSGGTWTVKPATTEEIEANTSLKYHKDFLANTIDDVLRLKRVKRNLDFLAEHAADLEDQGLFVPRNGKIEAPPPPGTTRLYRVETAGSPHELADEWKSAPPGMQLARGRWFTDNKKSLSFYLRDKERGSGVHYLDIPTAEAEKYRVSNTPEVDPNAPNIADAPRFYSKAPDREFFVPRTMADAKRPIESVSKLDVTHGGSGVEGMKEVDLPQMKGWADPKVANVLNDFFRRDPGDLDGFLMKANRFLTGMMFATPVPHIANVGTHWAVGRGWEWLTPRGYGSLVADGARAVRAVMSMNEDLLVPLRHGAGLLSPSVEMENFHSLLTNKLFNEQLADEGGIWSSFARAVIHPAATAADLVRAEYRWSRQTLWRANDVFMLQRIFELQRHGLSLDEAIFQAEKDIPNYRVPSEVLGSHAVSQALQSGVFVMFGRYKYGLVRSLALMVNDLARGSAMEKLEAVGKLTVLGALAYTWPSWIRPSGPVAVVNAAHNLLTEGQQKWQSFVSSLMILSPAMDIATSIKSGLDAYGNAIVKEGASAGGAALEALEGAAKQTYPGQIVLALTKPGGLEKVLGQALSLKLGPQYKESPAQKRRAAAEARRAEQRDPIESWIKRHWHQATQ